MYDWLRPIAYLTGIGWYVGISLLLGALLGLWLDDVTGAGPVFTLGGVLVGLAVALYGGIRMLFQFLRAIEPKGNDRMENH